MHTPSTFAVPTHSSALDVYQFGCRGAEWFLKQQGTVNPIEMYLNMSYERALTRAVDRVKRYGGILRIHDEDGFVMDERTYPRAIQRQPHVQERGLAA